MNSLELLKNALLKTGSVGTFQIRGLILDYLPHSRDLKQQLLGAVDTGVFQDLLHCTRVSSSTQKLYTPKLTSTAGNSKRGLSLFNLLLYLCGHLDSCPITDFDSLTRSDFGSSPVQVNAVSSRVNPTSKSQGSSITKHLRQLLILVSLLTVSIILLSIIRRSTSLDLQSDPARTILNEVVKNKRAPEQDPSQGFTPDMLPGRYVGTLTKNGTKRSFALIIHTLKNDSLFCTMKDYPHYDDPRVDFIVTIRNGKLCMPGSGELYYRDGCISSGDDLKNQSAVIWEFYKMD